MGLYDFLVLQPKGLAVVNVECHIIKSWSEFYAIYPKKGILWQFG